MSRREIALSVAAALWGLAVAIALVPLFSRPAPSEQLPSYPTSIGLDANAPIFFIVAAILLPLIFAAALRPAIVRLATAQRWAGNVFGWTCVVELWVGGVGGKLAWVFLPCAAILIAMLALRHRDLRFTRRDVILLPVYGATFIALCDALPQVSVDRVLVLAGLIVLAVRIAVTFVPGQLEPAFAFLFAPLALALQTSFWARELRYFGWHALAIVIITPFIARPLLSNRRHALIALTFVIYPIAVYSYTNAVHPSTAEGKPRVNFFEDAHHLVPASEMLRGERLYRDIVPVHGLIEDGVFSYAIARVRGDSIGGILRGRNAVNMLNSVAIYALAGAMTGSIEVGLLAAFFAAITGATNATIRVLPALVTLAILAYAVRRRKPRWFGYAGAGAAVSVLASLDFGLFTIVALIVTLIRSSPLPLAGEGGAKRRVRVGELIRTLIRPSGPPSPASGRRLALIGFLAVAFGATIVLAAFGVLDDFLRTTLFELPSGAAANRLNVFTAPAGFKAFANVPEIVIAFFAKTSFLYIAWVVALLIVAVAIPRRANRRFEPVVIVAVWIVISGLAYAQRHHLFFEFALPALLASIGWFLRRTPYGAIYIFLIVAASQPTAHIAITSWLRHSRGPLEPRWIEVADVPRARGALFTSNDAAIIATTKAYLSPNETFFDFSDRGLLYFLLDRDCPIRWPVVPFYETEELQREVIASIESNPNVRAALIPNGPGVDNIPNQVRAPLVWNYLQKNFTPDFTAGEVAFWRRVESRR